MQLVVQDRLLVQHLPVLRDLSLVHTLTLSQLLLTVRGLRVLLQYFVAHLVDCGGELTDQLIFLSDLREETLDLLEGSATDELVQALAHLSEALFEVKLPVVTHESELLLEGLSSQLGGLNVPV